MGKEVVNYGSAVNDGTGEAVHSAAAKLDAGARLFGVIDKDLTAPPGSPSIGDCYIVGASATGAWAAHDGEIAVYGLGATWLFVSLIEGLFAYVRDEDKLYKYDGSAWTEFSAGGGGGGNNYYDVPLSYAGGPPTSSEVIGALVMAREVTFAADFAGSEGYIGANPTSSFVISVKVDGVEIGTITVSTAGAFTFATTGGTSKVVAVGSLLEFIAPASTDATAAKILATLAGTA